MLVASFGALMVLAPAPNVSSDVREFGPFRVERNTTLQWPGLYAPAFWLVKDRRRVHRFSLGFNAHRLSALTFDIVMVEPSSDGVVRARAAAWGSPEARGSTRVGMGVLLPAKRPLRLSLGQSVVGSVLGAGRGGLGAALGRLGSSALLSGRL